jgi:hypothetical protein
MICRFGSHFNKKSLLPFGPIVWLSLRVSTSYSMGHTALHNTLWGGNSTLAVVLYQKSSASRLPLRCRPHLYKPLALITMALRSFHVVRSRSSYSPHFFLVYKPGAMHVPHNARFTTPMTESSYNLQSSRPNNLNWKFVRRITL